MQSAKYYLMLSDDETEPCISERKLLYEYDR